jgi:hypothetical protein
MRKAASWLENLLAVDEDGSNAASQIEWEASVYDNISIHAWPQTSDMVIDA